MNKFVYSAIGFAFFTNGTLGLGWIVAGGVGVAFAGCVMAILVGIFGMAAAADVAEEEK